MILIRRRAALVLGASLVLGAAFASAAGCSLGLDQSLINAHADAAVDGSIFETDGGLPATDSAAPPVDAGAEAGLVASCAKDTDCTSNQACLTGRCDLSRGACVYDVCPTSGTTCSAATCTNGKCDAPVAQKFAGARIAVPNSLSCGVVQRCIAAAHPWVFVGTNSGVLAYAASPADPSPTPIPVTNLPFLAQSIVASGNRVYVLGGLVNSGTVKVQLAWFDVPLDPLTKSITATSALVTTNHPTGDLLLPLPALSALLTQQAALPLFAGTVTAPFNGTSVVLQYDTLDAGASPASVAGTAGPRLVMWRNNGVNSSVQPIATPGTTTQSAGAALDTTLALGAVQGATFASGADGSLRIHYYTMPSAGQYRTHVTELFENGTVPTLSTKFPVTDIDNYATPPAVGFLGPLAWIDQNSVLAVSAVPPGVAAPLASHVSWVDNKKSPQKTLALATGVGSIAVAGSAGIGWALTNDTGAMPPAASLYYISPQCTP